MASEETARQVARQWFDHAHLDWPPHEHEVLASLIAAALAAEREAIYRAIEAEARALDSDLLKAAGTNEWPKLASRMNGLQAAADLVFNRARDFGSPIKR